MELKFVEYVLTVELAFDLFGRESLSLQEPRPSESNLEASGFLLSLLLRLEICCGLSLLCPEEWIAENIFSKEALGYVSARILSHTDSAGLSRSWIYLAVILEFECPLTPCLYIYIIKILKRIIRFDFCHTFADQVLVIELHGRSLSNSVGSLVSLSLFWRWKIVKISHHLNNIGLANLTVEKLQIFQHISLLLLTMANLSLIILYQFSKLVVFSDCNWEILNEVILESGYHFEVI